MLPLTEGRFTVDGEHPPPQSGKGGGGFHFEAVCCICKWFAGNRVHYFKGSERIDPVRD